MEAGGQHSLRVRRAEPFQELECIVHTVVLNTLLGQQECVQHAVASTLVYLTQGIAPGIPLAAGRENSAHVRRAEPFQERLSSCDQRIDHLRSCAWVLELEPEIYLT